MWRDGVDRLKPQPRQDRPAVIAGVDGEVAHAVAPRFVRPRRDQRAIEAAAAMAGQGRAAPEIGEVAAGVEADPAGARRPAVDIGDIDRETIGQGAPLGGEAFGQAAMIAAPHRVLDGDDVGKLRRRLEPADVGVARRRQRARGEVERHQRLGLAGDEAAGEQAGGQCPGRVVVMVELPFEAMAERGEHRHGGGDRLGRCCRVRPGIDQAVILDRGGRADDGGKPGWADEVEARRQRRRIAPHRIVIERHDAGGIHGADDGRLEVGGDGPAARRQLLVVRHDAFAEAPASRLHVGAELLDLGRTQPRRCLGLRRETPLAGGKQRSLVLSKAAQLVARHLMGAKALGVGGAVGGHIGRSCRNDGRGPGDGEEHHSGDRS